MVCEETKTLPQYTVTEWYRTNYYYYYYYYYYRFGTVHQYMMLRQPGALVTVSPHRVLRYVRQGWCRPGVVDLEVVGPPAVPVLARSGS